MLEHHQPTPRRPDRVVILGRTGFVAGAVAARLDPDEAPTRALGAGELDLLGADAGSSLARALGPSDALVVPSTKLVLMPPISTSRVAPWPPTGGSTLAISISDSAALVTKSART